MSAEKLGGGSGGAAAKGRAWFCATGLPSDIVVEVDEMSFHLHKFPLMDKSGKIHWIITAKEQRDSLRERRRRGRRKGDRTDDGDKGGEIREEHDEEEEGGEEEDQGVVTLPQFPGGAETFEAVAKFCYGVKVELTAWNVAPLRCAAEYLQMTEDVAEDNLVAQTERFLANSVLRSLKDSIKGLKSCEELMPVADDLGIVQRCLDSIAACASSIDPAYFFGWPMNDGRTAATAADRVLWNGIDTGIRRRRIRSSSSSLGGPVDSWFEDLAILSLSMYKRVVAAMKTRGLGSDVVEGSLLSYAGRSIPGLSRAARRRHSSAPLMTETEQRELLETVITNLPKERSPPASAAAATKFLFGLLRTAYILRASEEARAALERKISSQLEQAAPEDLLIPSYSYHAETLYDVDCVERILTHFLAAGAVAGGGVEEEDRVESGEIVAAGEGEGDDAAAGMRRRRRLPERAGALKAVAKLVDGYLAEIASDVNLQAQKFCELAAALPDDARVYHDGLYRAVDIYLKAHPRMTEEEKERVCGAIDYRRLTLEACTHAAQNERLPLRAVVEVLFYEQLQLRRAITGSLLAGGDRRVGAPPPPTAAAEGARRSERRTSWRSAIEENQVLRLDMDSMRNRVQELERECSSMKTALGKLDGGRDGAAASAAAEGGGRRGKGSKLGCRFTTQVCDSHERNVVQSRASRLGLSP